MYVCMYVCVCIGSTSCAKN